jgi:demethylmenaquinone methyltransferase/2-methoxy-6-polyprenyl-1,4-benzoquinol methylase
LLAPWANNSEHCLFPNRILELAITFNGDILVTDRLREESKEELVRDMFSRIAPAYDLVNRFMSWGRDTHWRQVAVDLACPERGRVLDVATGTGDLALELARRNGSVVGLDFCPEMIKLGKLKVGRRKMGGQIDFILGDALTLPFENNSFDCALNGFVLRNVSDVNLFLSELRRVVKPGGRVVCLELAKPQSGLIGALYRFYLCRIVPVLGHWLSGDKKAYQYLPDSVSSFVNIAELQQLMKRIGFHQVGYRSLNWGTIAVHIGVK